MLAHKYRMNDVVAEVVEAADEGPDFRIGDDRDLERRQETRTEARKLEAMGEVDRLGQHETPTQAMSKQRTVYSSMRAKNVLLLS